MAAVEVTISGVLYDKVNRTQQNVVLIGEASLTGLGVGGGPVIPPGSPPGIWGGGNVPMPTPPIPIYPGGTPNPPGIWGPPGPWPTPPIYLPPQLPPEMKPPEAPSPGDPTSPVPPPAGSAGWPVQPIAIPEYIVVWYPGIGPIVVPPPVGASPQKK